MSKPQGNHPLRYPTIYNISISKEEMGIISTNGLIKGMDENGFVIYDSDNLSGSHVYWSNLKEIRQTGDSNGILLIYKNLSDEILQNNYENWDELMDHIPEDFGDFSNLKKSELPEDDFSELIGLDYDQAKDMVAEINQMRADFMGNNSEENSEEEESYEQEEETQDEFTFDTPTEEEAIGESEEEEVIEEDSTPEVEEETRYEVAEYETSPKMSDQALLQKILAEASGSRYGSENLRYSNRDSAQEPTSNITFKANASIAGMSSLGFEVSVGQEQHKIDFGKFSDAYFSESGDSIVFEHRNGKTITFPQTVQGWITMIQKMPFRFRSFDRKLMLKLVNDSN